jgi:hypothetical protein
MPADEEWYEWVDKFVAKIVQILGSENAKCKLERVAGASPKPEKELIHAAIVTDLKRGRKIYMNAVKVPKKPHKANSIGRIYATYCSLLDE